VIYAVKQKKMERKYDKRKGRFIWVKLDIRMMDENQKYL
jgi:hypothetical protein